jgi:hypothetical protein
VKKRDHFEESRVDGSAVYTYLRRTAHDVSTAGCPFVLHWNGCHHSEEFVNFLFLLIFMGHSVFGMNRSHRYNNRTCVIMTTNHPKVETERSAETLYISNVPDNGHCPTWCRY